MTRAGLGLAVAAILLSAAIVMGSDRPPLHPALATGTVVEVTRADASLLAADAETLRRTALALGAHSAIPGETAPDATAALAAPAPSAARGPVAPFSAASASDPLPATGTEPPAALDFVPEAPAALASAPTAPTLAARSIATPTPASLAIATTAPAFPAPTAPTDMASAAAASTATMPAAGVEPPAAPDGRVSALAAADATAPMTGETLRLALVETIASGRSDTEIGAIITADHEIPSLRVPERLMTARDMLDVSRSDAVSALSDPVDAGHTIHSVAELRYGSPEARLRIVEANAGTFARNGHLTVGQTLILPD